MSKDPAFNLILNFLESAKEKKQGIYSDFSLVAPQQLANEVKAAEAEFSRVIDKEVKRLKVFADRENDRILEVRRQNGAEVTCPICLEVIPAIDPEDVMLVCMACCGANCHHHCFKDWEMRKAIDPTMSRGCFHCRSSNNNVGTDRARIKYLEKMTLTGSTVSRGHALFEVGNAYSIGACGKKRSLEKALESYQKSADLGHKRAEAKIALICHYGDCDGMPAPKSPEKAMEMAQRAAEQGQSTAQLLLGTMLRQNDSGMNTAIEAHRLVALSAYQGATHGMLELEKIYYQQYQNPFREPIKSIQGSRRECLLLSLYWAGRACNRKGDELTPEAFMQLKMKFITHFHTTMGMYWHKRPSFSFDTNTGYSHIPFLTSIRKGCVSANTKNAFQIDDVWKHICANCGKQGMTLTGDKECVLKQCARCKSFSYCSKECQVKHWKAGHKVDCKGRHWIESYFPNLRTA